MSADQPMDRDVQEFQLEPHTIQLLTVPEQEAVLGARVHFEARDIPRAALVELFDAFALDNASNRMVDLRPVLGSVISMGSDSFFPREIWIRDCMKMIFKKFMDDEPVKASNRVLLGSPGVGKSVLFFIAAMSKALHGDHPVLYVRRTLEETEISAFGMFRSEGGLKILSCRNIDKKQFPTTPHVINGVRSCFGFDTLEGHLRFLDGPRHDDDKDLNSYYNYFCTAAGHPLPKNSQLDLFLWLLDGWSMNEAITFGASTGRPNGRDEYFDAYNKFGGCIRDMNNYVNGDEKKKKFLLSRLKGLTRRVRGKEIHLVLTTTTRSNNDDGGNPDRLRTMFNGEIDPGDIPESVQIVDSLFAARLLRGRYSMETLHGALIQGKVINSGTVVGIYFEEMLHQWFKDTLPNGVTEVKESHGSGADGVTQLTNEGQYWIPSIPNFANIDAAVVVGQVLYVFQYTKGHRHGFNEDTFWQDFVAVVFYQLQFTSIHVYVVGMDGLSPSLKVNFNRRLAANLTNSMNTRNSTCEADHINIQCDSSLVNIDTTTVDTVRTAALKGFKFGARVPGPGFLVPHASIEERDSWAPDWPSPGSFRTSLGELCNEK